MSRIHIVSMESGIPDIVEQQHFDSLATAINEIHGAQLFLMDLFEPVKLEELMEDLKMAQLKGDFRVIIISGLTYLNGNHKDGFFVESSRVLSEFAEQFGVEVLVLP